MRTSIKFIFLAWMLLLTTSSFAQKGIASVEKAAEKTIKQLTPYTVSLETNTYQEGAYYKAYEYSIPNNKFKKIVGPLNLALFENRDFAYQSLTKSGNSNNDSQIRVAFGENNSKAWLYGTNKERFYNIFLFKDPKNTKMHYAYASCGFHPKTARSTVPSISYTD